MKSYLFSLLLYNWLLFVVYWLVALLVFFAVVITIMVTLYHKEKSVFIDVLNGLVFPFEMKNVYTHGAALIIPMFVAVGVFLSTTIDKNRLNVQHSLQFYLYLMYYVFVAVYICGTFLVLLLQ